MTLSCFVSKFCPYDEKQEMQVAHLSIIWFRGIESASLDFDGYTLLIGMNNVGKSTACGKGGDTRVGTFIVGKSLISISRITGWDQRLTNYECPLAPLRLDEKAGYMTAAIVVAQSWIRVANRRESM